MVDNDLPPIADSRLRELASRLVREAQERSEGSDDYSTEDLIRWSGNGFIYELKAYETRRNAEPVLLISAEIPGKIAQAFQQARECYRWGLYAACFGLCRIVLEAAVRFMDEKKRTASWPLPVRDEFKPLLSSIPPDLLSEKEKAWASDFWTRSSKFLHGIGPLPGEDDAWSALRATATILNRLSARGALNPN